MKVNWRTILAPAILNMAFVFAAFDPNSHNNVAVYWGQGANQGSLGSYCEGGSIDIVLISFLNVVTSTKIGFNFGNACWGPECPLIAADIKKCQSLGVKVLLSIGGDLRMSNFGLTSDADGEKAAQLLYDMFNPKGNPKVAKVFGPDVEIDGFDLDVENRNQKGQIALFKKLRQIWTSKKLILTACPQCFYPDDNVFQVMIDGDVNLDYMFMQFYSNPSCTIGSKGFDGSWETWTNFVKKTSKLKNLKIFLTLQADCSNEWHIKLDKLLQKVANKKLNDLFMGFGAWDVTVGTNCKDNSLGASMSYIQGLKKIASGVYDSKIGKRDEL